VKRGTPASSLSSPRFTLNVQAERGVDNLIAEVWIRTKTCRVTIDTGASATIARTDVIAGQLERKPS
jgi:hypothetical protein